MMTKEQINRINELAKKKKECGLTPEETAERETLKKLYVESFRESLVNTMSNITVVEPDGSKHPLIKKTGPDQ